MQATRTARVGLLLVTSAVLSCGDAPDVAFDDVAGATGSELEQITDFGANPGNLEMHVFVPAGVGDNAPVVMAMHGCMQDAHQYQGAGWNPIAEELGFYVVYPEQPTGNNPVQCFNWAGEYGDETNLIRGRGENRSLVSMVEYMVAVYGADAERVFASGLSAGGAEAILLLATWPDGFAAGAVNAGLPYRCATSVSEAFSCQSSGRDLSAAAWGDLVRDAFPGYAGDYPRVSIWHGTADSIVSTVNQRELVEQWTDVHGIDAEPDQITDVEGHRRALHLAGGVTVVETIEVSGMGHGAAIDPTRPGGCGTPGSYILDAGVCAAYHQAEFFGLDNADHEAPVLTLQTPENGEVVTGEVLVTGTVTDNVGVARVELRVDDQLRAEVTEPGPTYEIAWDTTSEQNGERTVTVAARDAAGNRTSESIVVTVEGGISDLEPPTLEADPPGGAFTGVIEVTLVASEPADIFYTLDGSTPDTNSTPYTGPIVIEESTVLKAIAIDEAGNISDILTETYSRPTYDEVASGTCTEHYVAHRLDVTGYLECGATHGYMASVTLYRFGDCWTEDEAGTGCL